MAATRCPSVQELARDLSPQVEQAQQAMQAARTIPAEVEALIDRIADLMDSSLPAWGHEGVDPYLGQSLLAAVLSGEKGLRTADEDDRRKRVRLSLERLRQVLRDINAEETTDEYADTKEVLSWLAATVSVSQHELAELLGVSSRTLQRWLSADGSRPEGDDETRVRMVARTAAHLRHVFTGPGVVRWFRRPHPDLHGRPPAELLDDPTAMPVLVRLASKARSTIAT